MTMVPIGKLTNLGNPTAQFQINMVHSVHFVILTHLGVKDIISGLKTTLTAC